MRAIQSRRMARRHPRLRKRARRDRRGIAGRGAGMAEPVQQRHRRQAGQSRQVACRRAGRQRQQALEHIHIQSRQRQRRPAGTGGNVKQYDPAIAVGLRGDQRRAVSQPRPAAIFQFGRRLGQYLPRHRDLGGNFQPVEGRQAAEGRQVLRRAPRHRTAQISPAGAQPHRHQLVAAAGHAFARKTDQHAALGDKLFHPRDISLRNLRHIGQHQHRYFFVEQRGDRTLGDLGIGRQRPFQIIDIRQQRLALAGGAFRHDAGAALGRTFIQQLHRARAVLAHDAQPRRGVAHFHRQRDMTTRFGFAAPEMQPGHRQCLAANANGAGFRIRRLACGGADRGNGET